MPKPKHYYHRTMLWVTLSGPEYFPFSLQQRRGDIYELTGQWQMAEAIYCRNLEKAKSANKPELEALSGNALGWVLHLRCRNDEAQNLYERSMEIFQNTGNLRGLSKTLGYLGGVHYYQGRYSRAVEYYQRRLELSEKIGDAAGICAAYNNLGNVAGEQGRNDQAYGYYIKALDVAEKNEDLIGQSSILGNIGVVYWTKGDYPKALDWFNRQCKLAKSIGNKYVLCSAISNIASIWLLTGDYDQALKYIEQRVLLANEMDDIKGLSIVLDYKAEICKDRNDHKNAERFYLQAIELGRRCNAKFHLCGYLHGLAGLYCQTERYAQAADYNCQALDMAEEIGEPQILGDSQLLALRIEAIKDRNKAVMGLQQMLNKEQDQSRKAEIHYWLYKHEGGTLARDQALQMFRDLYSRTPNYGYKRKIAELENS